MNIIIMELSLIPEAGTTQHLAMRITLRASWCVGTIRYATPLLLCYLRQWITSSSDSACVVVSYDHQWSVTIIQQDQHDAVFADVSPFDCLSEG